MSVWRADDYVNWLSLFNIETPVAKTTEPHHGGQCGGDLANTCWLCRSYLTQFPPSQREAEGRKLSRRLRGLPPPLKARTVQRIALEMVEHPETFGPIVEFLVNFQRERQG